MKTAETKCWRRLRRDVPALRQVLVDCLPPICFTTADEKLEMILRRQMCYVLTELIITSGESSVFRDKNQAGRVFYESWFPQFAKPNSEVEELDHVIPTQDIGFLVETELMSILEPFTPEVRGRLRDDVWSWLTSFLVPNPVYPTNCPSELETLRVANPYTLDFVRIEYLVTEHATERMVDLTFEKFGLK